MPKRDLQEPLTNGFFSDKVKNVIYFHTGEFMGKEKAKSAKSTARSEKKESKKLEIAYGLRDPAIANAVRIALIVLVALAFAVNIVVVVFLSVASVNDGMYLIGDEYSTVLSDPSSGIALDRGAVFRDTPFYAGDTVGVRFITRSGEFGVYEAKVASVTSTGVVFEGDAVEYDRSVVLGVKTGDITSSFVLAVMDDPIIVVILDVVFVVLAVVAGLLYFLVSPRGAKKYEKKDESGEKAKAAPAVVALSQDNASLLMKYISSDDNISPLEEDVNVLPGSFNTNYYTSVRLHDGEIYAVVRKYSEMVPTLEEYGASDMDVIRMNMAGNAEFENLILLPHKEKTMTMREVIDLAESLPGVYCIKKRGTLNWVFKYKSKTVLIVKENDDHSGYKASVKVYPDAAYKLNIIYKALEDSTFPIGPFWYMFNDLRNLPANVISWLVTESYNISRWQQVRADILRDTPPLEKYGFDVQQIRAAVLSGTPVKDYGKFVVITQKVTPANKYETVLETGVEGLDVDEFTKEFAMVIPHAENMSFSMLTRKNASEALVTSFCNEMNLMCEQDVVASQPQAENEEVQRRIVRRSATVKKKMK